MNLIAIDPGRTTGWAVFEDSTYVKKQLCMCGSLKKAELWDCIRTLRVLHRAVIELPRWYPHDQKDVNDLIDLAVQVGEVKHFLEAARCEVELVWPRTWKGNVKKEIMTERILSRLTPDELALVPLRPRARTPDHNAVDAIGLGLWKLGRLR